MKSVWQGSISFGLVNVPVKIFSVAEPKQFSFHLLCGNCKTPLKYKRWCPKCKKEVSWENVLYGFEIQKGKWKSFTKKQISNLKPEKSNQIEILLFSTINHFDPILFSKHYYAIPSQEKEKVYFLFKEALRITGKVALGKMILHQKEHLVLVQAYKKGLLLTTLFYPYEIKDIKRFSELNESVKLSKREIDLAIKLIKNLTKEPKLEEYEDSFEKSLRKIILGKIEKKKEKPKPEKLLKALELSIRK